MSYRIVKKIVTGRQAIDGAGGHLVRVLGSGTIRDFDPFLMLDAFDSLNPADYVRGFPLHPHRGIDISGERRNRPQGQPWQQRAD